MLFLPNQLEIQAWSVMLLFLPTQLEAQAWMLMLLFLPNQLEIQPWSLMLRPWQIWGAVEVMLTAKPAQ
jgi:hypothetical protein